MVSPTKILFYQVLFVQRNFALKQLFMTSLYTVIEALSLSTQDDPRTVLTREHTTQKMGA